MSLLGRNPFAERQRVSREMMQPFLTWQQQYDIEENIDAEAEEGEYDEDEEAAHAEESDEVESEEDIGGEGSSRPEGDSNADCESDASDGNVETEEPDVEVASGRDVGFEARTPDVAKIVRILRQLRGATEVVRVNLCEQRTRSSDADDEVKSEGANRSDGDHNDDPNAGSEGRRSAIVQGSTGSPREVNDAYEAATCATREGRENQEQSTRSVNVAARKEVIELLQQLLMEEFDRLEQERQQSIQRWREEHVRQIVEQGDDQDGERTGEQCRRSAEQKRKRCLNQSMT